MTVNKPTVIAWAPSLDLANLSLNGGGRNGVGCILTAGPTPHGNDVAMVRLEDYESLQTECEKLRALLLQSAPIVHAHAGASHMLDGFKPKRNKWDELVERIDAAIAAALQGDQP